MKSEEQILQELINGMRKAIQDTQAAAESISANTIVKVSNIINGAEMSIGKVHPKTILTTTINSLNEYMQTAIPDKSNRLWVVLGNAEREMQPLNSEQTRGATDEFIPLSASTGIESGVKDDREL